MILRPGSYLLPTVLAVILHIFVVVLLAQSWFEHKEEERKVPRHVQAQIVDLTTLSAQRKKASEAKAKQKADQIRKAEEDKKRKADEKRRQEKAKKEAEKKKQLEKKKAEAEKKRKADEKRKKEAAKKKAEQDRLKKAAAEKKRKADEKKRKDAEKKAAEEKKRNAEAAAKKQAEEKARNEALMQALQAEEAALQAEEQRAAAMSYEAYIVSQITRNWRRSPTARNGMVVEITVHFLPSGRVNDLYVSKSSGDARFDNDALRAIERVQVFEKLQEMDSIVFDRYFRKRVLRFRPEDLRN
ncbi:cell envelope integrity protein TolA [Neptuniibacter sp. QD72_48]|uniref:cell envelope integrity protein TolA n=1 Tax=unclassified Neptuniibacter TaxID=2630693 RepID=UPI0039F5A23B